MNGPKRAARKRQQQRRIEKRRGRATRPKPLAGQQIRQAKAEQRNDGRSLRELRRLFGGIVG